MCVCLCFFPGGSFAEQNIASAALDSRWILYGLLGGRDVPSGFLASMMAKRIKLQATTLRSRTLDYKVQEREMGQANCVIPGQGRVL
jgi:hypothetical protein